MIRILVCDGMEKSALDKLRVYGFEVVDTHFEPQELEEQIKNFDAAIVRSATKVSRQILQSSLETGRLKLVIRAGVGLDNIDVEFAKQNGIDVYNTPKASSRAVAELALGHMLSVARFLHISNVTMRKGEWNKKQYKGVELFGKTLGIIGFGRIGVQTAFLASCLGMKVLYYQRSGAKPGYDEYEYAAKDELLKKSDFISLHAPYSKVAGAILEKEDFDMMKDGVYIINTSRGQVINENALLDALDSGKVAAAALDVFQNEPNVDKRILEHERISLSPHIAGSTKQAQQRIGQEAAAIVLHYFKTNMAVNE